MRRVWASVFSVWALLALVAVLAWTRAPTPVSQQGGPRVVVVHTPNGPRKILVAPAPHATTHTSGVASRAVGG